MFMKERTFEKEEKYLSECAQKSNATRGRLHYETPCNMRTDFQRDRDRIIYSKAFMRLKNKTQVFFSPEGDHYRTRLTHTLDVSQVARSIARELNLNEDLAEAIALGHDLGHTPFGHAGERSLNDLSSHGFKHNEQSLRVVDVLENNGEGLNLTQEVRDGILNHKLSGTPMTLEGQVVSLADRISYVTHDIDDAVRGKIITLDELPEKSLKKLGYTTSDRLDSMIHSIYRASYKKDKVAMEEEYLQALNELRLFMFDRVYLNEQAKKEEIVVRRMLESMFNLFKKQKEYLPEFYRGLLEKYDDDTVICDYLSSMTDRYVVYTFEELFVPRNFYIKG
ncbi:MAG: deoxyguanosinetriphosphate triphosphohydrolase [Christensenellaceae bacterium]